jgi:tRNA (guanine37-N1)-methyltransferase
MKISVITLFPELYAPFINSSLVKKAQESGIISSDIQSLFSFVEPKVRVDAPIFGHGSGMLIKPSVVEKAVSSQENKFGPAFKIFFSPQGKKLNQTLVKEMAQKILDKGHVMLLPARYEGMDSRVEEYYADEVISIGDYVLMGGDLPAMVFLEAILRFVPGVVGKSESVEKDSFTGPFVDFPNYTEPVDWKGMSVPDVLRSGNHQEVDKWRSGVAIRNSVIKHFDWVRSYDLTKEQIDSASKYIPNHYSVLMHSDVLVNGASGFTSVTSLDIHDIARSSTTYGLKNYFLVTPLEDQKKIVKTLIDFWQTGVGISYNPHRHESVNKVVLKDSLSEVVEHIEKIEGIAPVIVATSAKEQASRTG